jgi:hypothetical protein
MKFCKDCKYFIKAQDAPISGSLILMVRKTESCGAPTNLVLGTTRENKPSCYDCRENGQLCGPMGLLFEPMETELNVFSNREYSKGVERGYEIGLAKGYLAGIRGEPLDK